MVPVMRFLLVLPLVLAVVGFVLTALTLFAGHRQAFMEDYAIVRLNTSMIGRNMLSPAKAKPRPDDGARGRLEAWWDARKHDANDRLNEAAGGLARRLTVPDWYSLHVMAACQGNFEPGPGLNVTNCTVTAPARGLNLTRMLDRELALGPVRLSLADMDWPESLQDKVDVLNNALLALFVVYVAAVLLSAAALALLSGPLVLVNLVVASLAGLACIVGSAVISVAGSKAVRSINERGARVGISAERGLKFEVMAWVATGLMLAQVAFWLALLLVLRWRARRGAKQPS